MTIGCKGGEDWSKLLYVHLRVISHRPQSAFVIRGGAYVSARGAADLIGLPLRTTVLLITSGRLPAVAVGRNWLVLQSDALAFASTYVRHKRRTKAEIAIAKARATSDTSDTSL